MMFTFATMTACGGDDEGPDVPALDPEVTSFSPVTVVEGTNVTISGTDFPTDPSQITVTFFDGVQASIVSASATEIVVTVPDGAQNGPITVTIGGEDFVTNVDADVRLDIPRDGLVAFYPFTGDATDASDNSNNGTVNGATLTTDRYGNPNSAYSFDGVDDFIEVADDATLDITGAITLSAWVNMDEIKSCSILYKYISDNNNNVFNGYAIGLNGSYNDFTFYLDEAYLLEGNSVIEINNWHHVAMTYDGQMMRMYYDGSMIAEKAYANGFTSTDSNFFIGKNPYTTALNFNGLIDDIAIYNLSLSDAEVTQLYNQTITE